MANASGSRTAVNEQWFPPLKRCRDNGNCPTALQPQDLLVNANLDLVKQLTRDQACMSAATTFVFNKVLYGGL